MNIEVGQTYLGPHRARRRVLSADADRVDFVLPISLTHESASRAEFEAWVAAGEAWEAAL